MAVAKRRLVVATSEPYPDGTVRPPEELEAAVKRRREVPLTLGHPPRNVRGIPEEYLLGKVEFTYDAEGQRKFGDTTFYTEYWDRIPKRLQEMIENDSPLPISEGFTNKWRDENTIINIVPDHVALLVDERPLCPLSMCGVNVRMESDSNNYRYEQRTEASEDKAELAKRDPVDEVREDIQELRKEFREFIESQRPKQEATTEQPATAPVVVEHEEPQNMQAEPQAPRKSRTPPEPVREVPASVPNESKFERDPVTGGIIFRSRYDRSREK